MTTSPSESQLPDRSVLRAAVVQMTSGADREANRERAAALVHRAAEQGAELVALPERFAHIDARRTLQGAESLEGPTIAAARGWARDLGIHLLAGSVAEAGAPGGRAYNTSVLIGADGEVAGVYRKLHLFDVDVAGRVYRESRATAPGDAVVAAPACGRMVGLSVCYDLRFPELYRALVDRGAEILAVPAAFTQATGADHWEPLLRARAIENQCFVLAPGQWGRHEDGTVSHGRSMIVDPWGTILAQAGDGEGVATADLDFVHLDDVRARLPALRHRRPPSA
jgi:deaminated glutathione amidase